MNIIELAEIDSTNLYAKLNLDILPDKSVILAQKQTNGRGRFDRTWIDLGEGNVFISIVLKPSDVFLPVYSNLTQYLSVILCRIFDEYGIDTTIKWPNDVLCHGRKISGILSETVVKGNLFKGLVLGFGVNLNASKNSLKSIKDKEATALNIELGREYVDKKLFVEKLLKEFFRDYEEFLKAGFILVKDEYIKRASFLGKHIEVQVLNKKVCGEAKMINDDGELIIHHLGKDLILTIGDIL